MPRKTHNIDPLSENLRSCCSRHAFSLYIRGKAGRQAIPHQERFGPLHLPGISKVQGTTYGQSPWSASPKRTLNTYATSSFRLFPMISFTIRGWVIFVSYLVVSKKIY